MNAECVGYELVIEKSDFKILKRCLCTVSVLLLWRNVSVGVMERKCFFVESV